MCFFKNVSIGDGCVCVRVLLFVIIVGNVRILYLVVSLLNIFWLFFLFIIVIFGLYLLFKLNFRNIFNCVYCV